MVYVFKSYQWSNYSKFLEIMKVCSCLNPANTCYSIFKNDHTNHSSGYELLVSHCGIPYFLIITIRSPFPTSRKLGN